MNEIFATVIQAAIGRWQTITQITSRADSEVWRATLINGVQVAVKITIGPGNEGLVAAREAAVIRAAGASAGRVLAGGRLIEGGSWLVTPWWHGPTLADQLAELRGKAAERTAHRVAARAAAQAAAALADLHQAGWVHGGVRAEHFIHTAHGVRLVDLAWARGPAGSLPADLDFPYIGTLHRLDAAEIARRLRANTLVTPTPEGDVHTFARALWHCWSGAWPTDPEADGAVPGKGRRAVDPLGWPGFEVALETALAPEPDVRPTATVLAGALSLLAELEAVTRTP
ncbi:hypothetical protein [Streptomyces sp. NPDC127098]|uniref:hypothetical protein n=1 Tax=Streptomyces sp. NPDC127098 TaxID=3347137 RepID=UPI003668BB20